MTARTLEEIEREIGKLGAQKWYGAAHTLRLLAIAQKQRGAMAADEERTRAAAMRVWGEHVRGCDTADAMADLIVRQRAEIERLRNDLEEANECRDPAYFAQLGRKRKR